MHTIPAEEPPDADLVQAARSGDEAAFRALVERHGAHVRAWARSRLGGDSLLADEVTQEVFIRLFRSMNEITVGESLRPWLRTVTVNLVRDLQRATSRERKIVGLEALPGSASSSSRPTDERVLARERAAFIRSALAGLSPERREAIVLRFWNGLTYDQIAERTGVPQGTVASRVHRGLRDLAHELADTDLAPTGAGTAHEDRHDEP